MRSRSDAKCKRQRTVRAMTSSSQIHRSALTISGASEPGQMSKHETWTRSIRQRISVAWLEGGESNSHFHFSNKCSFEFETKVFFIFSKETNYLKPIFLDSSGKIKSVVENRYYFYNENLFKWISNSKINSHVSKKFKIKSLNLNIETVLPEKSALLQNRK